jgi:hypothetical protein
MIKSLSYEKHWGKGVNGRNLSVFPLETREILPDLMKPVQ